jgi:hypothetical protein
MRHQQRYMPVLWWKKGEQDAVKHLFTHDKLKMTPLLNVLGQRPPEEEGIRESKRQRPKSDWLTEMADTIEKSWGYAPALVEVHALGGQPIPAGPLHPVVRLFDEARARGLRLVPVGRLTYRPVLRAAIWETVVRDGRGMCIRLTRRDLARPALQADLQNLLDDLALTPAEADLVLDFEIVDASGFDLMVACALLPILDEWRSFTVVGGAFPKDLGGPLQTPGRHLQSRYEWRTWTDQIGRSLPRTPAYGDYAMRYPLLIKYERRPTPSASIRYTVDRDWVVMRGQQLNAERFVQYRANAQLLKAGTDYKGESFSYGDQCIHEIATGTKNTGNPQSWLTVGVNHHLTLAVLQLASLFDSSSGHAHMTVADPAAPLPQAGRTTLPSAFQLSHARDQAAPTT